MEKDREKYLLLATFGYSQLRCTNLQNQNLWTQYTRKWLWHFKLIMEDRLNEKIEKASKAKMYITKISKLSLTKKVKCQNTFFLNLPIFRLILGTR